MHPHPPHTPVQDPVSAPARVLGKADVAASTDKLQQQKRLQRRSSRVWRVLFYIWLIVVAGLPIYYYLLPDRDWNYEYWGAPEEILVSSRSRENPWRGDEGVFTRIFIARPSAENMQQFRVSANSSYCAERMNKLLAEYEMPGSYRYGEFFGHGWVDVVDCSNGLLLVADYSRNKGGLFSSRMGWENVQEHYPLHFIFAYAWACLGLLVLLLTPFLAIPAGGGYLLFRIVRAFWKLRCRK